MTFFRQRGAGRLLLCALPQIVWAQQLIVFDVGQLLLIGMVSLKSLSNDVQKKFCVTSQSRVSVK